MRYVMLFILPLLIIAVAVSISVYRIGLQQQVYKRQGIEISRWELFMGCIPAVKVSQ